MRFGRKEWVGEEPRADTPVGERCMSCDDPIAAGDDGEMRFRVSEDMQPSIHPEHKECMLRRVFGSVGHQFKKCCCYGGDYEDPPGLTKHEAALCAMGLAFCLTRIDPGV